MNRISSIALASLLTFAIVPAANAGLQDQVLKKLRLCRPGPGNEEWCPEAKPPTPKPPGDPNPPGECKPVCSPDGQWCTTCGPQEGDGRPADPFDLPIVGNGIAVADGDVVVLRGHGWHAEVGKDAIAWCVEPEMAADGRGRCGFNPTPTTFGCQYFPEEGPADDLMVCILTILDGMCGGCISGCQGDECGEEE